MNKSLWAAIGVLVVVLALSAIVFLIGNGSNEIDVSVLDITYQSDHYYVTISVKNNQNIPCWVSDTYLSTVQGSIIDLTGGGVEYSIQPGEPENITLWSANVPESITDSPFTLTFTAFPSGKKYTVDI